MNAEKHLLLLKGEDRTEDVRYCRYDNGKYIVTFLNGKTYVYAGQHVQWLRNPQVLDPKNYIVYKDELPLTGIQSIYVLGDWIKIRFVSGYTHTYPKNNYPWNRTVLPTRSWAMSWNISRADGGSCQCEGRRGAELSKAAVSKNDNHKPEKRIRHLSQS